MRPWIPASPLQFINTYMYSWKQENRTALWNGRSITLGSNSAVPYSNHISLSIRSCIYEYLCIYGIQNILSTADQHTVLLNIFFTYLYYRFSELCQIFDRNKNTNFKYYFLTNSQLRCYMDSLVHYLRAYEYSKQSTKRSPIFTIHHYYTDTINHNSRYFSQYFVWTNKRVSKRTSSSVKLCTESVIQSEKYCYLVDMIQNTGTLKTYCTNSNAICFSFTEKSILLEFYLQTGYIIMHQCHGIITDFHNKLLGKSPFIAEKHAR